MTIKSDERHCWLKRMLRNIKASFLEIDEGYSEQYHMPGDSELRLKFLSRNEIIDAACYSIYFYVRRRN